jgi:hypothetical protein
MKSIFALGLLLASCGVEEKVTSKQVSVEEGVCSKTPFPNKQIEEQCLEQQRARAINERTESEFGNRDIK